MLELVIPGEEQWDESKEEFVVTRKETVLQLEHSLVSISKWESKWCKPFLSKTEKTPEETLDYIRCMTITQNVKPDTYNHLTRENIQAINEYIDAPMTATWFSKETNTKTNSEQITNELIYYWMISLNIPVEFQKWHLNHLLTLIRVCNVKNQPPKKMSQKDLTNRNAALNAARRKRSHAKG